MLNDLPPKMENASDAQNGICVCVICFFGFLYCVED